MRLRMMAVALAAATPLALAGIATAAPGDLSVSPTSGPAGTTISVTGQCPATPTPAADPTGVAVLLDGNGDPISGDEVSLSGTSFTVSFPVPAGTPAGSYVVAAACFAGNDPNENPYFEFNDRSFTVTSTRSDTPTVGIDSGGGGSVAVPATPRRATPTFTG